MLIQVSQPPPKALEKAAWIFLGSSVVHFIVGVLDLVFGHGFNFNINILGVLVFCGLVARKPGWRVFGIILASLTILFYGVLGVLIFASAAFAKESGTLPVVGLILLFLQLLASCYELYLLLRSDVTGWFTVINLPPSAIGMTPRVVARPPVPRVIATPEQPKQGA
jgi:hypothetical protein